jgi:PKD repeat protein
MKKIFKLTSLFLLVLFLFATCKKETPAPTASFTATVTGNVVTFTAIATDYTKFEWDFGDGSYINTIPSPTHTYNEYGKDFTVTLKVLGEGGQMIVINRVTIPPKTKMQLLTGGTAATSSKKWRISASAGIDFAVPNAALTVAKSYPAGILGAIGLAQVYTDEFVLKGDGSLTINPKGGGILAGFVYCALNGVAMAPDAGAKSAGLAYAKPFTTPAGATFTVNEGKNFVVPVTADGLTTANVTYTGVTTLSFANKGFIGIMDFMSECIVMELTDTKMKAAFFLSTVAPPATQIGKATNVLIVSFEVAP